MALSNSDADSLELPDGLPVGEYYASPRTRILVGIVLVVPITLFVVLGVAIRPEFPPDIGTVLFLLSMGILWIWLFGIIEAVDVVFSHIQVDEQGIHKIGGLRRNCLWPWDVFRSGKPQDRYGTHGLHIPEWPRACRTLPIGDLLKEDADRIKAYIDRIRPPRRLANPPAEVTFQSQGSRWRVVTMTPEDIILKRNTQEEVFGWEDVIEARLLRAEPGRLDFRELRLRLPGREIVKRCIRDDFDRKVDELQQIAHVLGRNIAAEKLKDFSLSGEPRSIEEFDMRYALSIPPRVASPRTMWITAWIAFAIWPILAAYLLTRQYMDGVLRLYMAMNGLLIVTFALITVVPAFGLYFLSIADDKRRKKRDRLHQQRRHELLTRLPLEHSF